MADLETSHARFWDAVRDRGLRAAAERTGAVASGTGLLVSMAGKRYRVDLADRAVRLETPDGSWSDAGFLESVVLLTYVATADGYPPAGEWVSEKGLALGDAYFRPPHALPVNRLAEAFGRDPDAFVAAARALGGVETGLADRGVEVPALPRVPIRFNLWLGDDEFPDPDVRVLFDRNATHYLILDGILALLNVVVKAFLEAGGRT